MYEQKINCPQCQSEILFDIYTLLKGGKFICQNCHAEISLAKESRDKVKDTMDKFEDVKQQAFRQAVK